MRFLLLSLLLFPIIELAVIIKVGSRIGVLATLALLAAGVLLGGALLRAAGMATAWRARERLALGELPDQEMVDGLFLAFGGLLLLLPGFISDLLALACLLPVTRRALIGLLRRRVERAAIRRRAFDAERPSAAGGAPRRPNVIEGEYERRDR